MHHQPSCVKRQDRLTAVVLSSVVVMCCCCHQVLHGLKGGALGGDMPPVMMWRMCISTSEQGTKIRPSLGGMLAAILLHRVQRTRQKASPAESLPCHAGVRSAQQAHSQQGMPLSTQHAFCGAGAIQQSA
jgi:hypothetical protein